MRTLGARPRFEEAVDDEVLASGNCDHSYDHVRLKSVTLNGKSWTKFDAGAEAIDIPAGSAGAIKIEARYEVASIR